MVEELQRLETTDPVFTEVAAKARAMWEPVALANGLAGVQVHFADLGSASAELQASAFNTAALASVLPSAIVVNTDFLRALDVAVRSFALSDTLLDSQYLRGEEQMYGLIRRYEQDPRAYLARLRALDRTPRRDSRAYVVQTLTLAVFFFIAHELGHLKAAGSGRSYTTFLGADAPLEHRIASAVFKLCRHADGLATHEFTLPGFQAVTDRTSPQRLRASELSAEIAENVRTNVAQWAADEDAADRFAETTLVGYLRALATHDPFSADQQRYVLIRGLFAAGLFSWYRDLLRFAEKVGVEGVPSTRELVVLMMEDRSRYIAAASLFGDVHGYTLLRAALAMEAVIRGTSEFFTQPADARSIWWKPPAMMAHHPARWWAKITPWDPERREEQSDLRAWWLAESLQRYYLLCILMDTAIKLANMGCATGWIVDADRRRESPQLFMMTFYGLASEVRRLRSFA